GLETLADRTHIQVFHAGTKLQDKHWTVNGGRAAFLVTQAPTLAQAQAQLKEALAELSQTAVFWRTDIGDKALLKAKE
ncbi:MAG: phosphoribosylglycinamide synthetase C domain-containing protein, partial [Culicoidibacterales bacterium]